MASRATIRDVASRAGVSTGTVSNYLTSRVPVSDRARGNIEAAISELGFIPNAAVRVLHGYRTSAIAFLISDAMNPFFAEVARGVEEVAVAEGLVVVVCNTYGDGSRENHYVKTLSEMRVLGAIVTPLSAAEENLRQLESSGASIVVLSTGAHALDYPSVDVDDRAGGRLAGRVFAERGHRDPVYFGGPGGEPQVDARFGGMYDAYQEAGFDPRRIRRVDALGSSASERRLAARRILDLDQPPSAVFCANDLLALALESEAISRGIAIPTELEVVGYDDIASAETAPVPLTTVRQPQFEIGVAAATMLLNQSRGGDSGSVTFAPELVLRSSTSSPSL